jgi:hypothetical protein
MSAENLSKPAIAAALRFAMREMCPSQAAIRLLSYAVSFGRFSGDGQTPSV